MAKMQAIDLLQVKWNYKIKKRFPQGGGVGVGWVLGEEKGNRE
jgi:hypothetical protein